MTDYEMRFRRNVILVLCVLAFVVGCAGLSIIGHNSPVPAAVTPPSADPGQQTPCITPDVLNGLVGAQERLEHARPQLRPGGSVDQDLVGASQLIAQASQAAATCPVPPPQVAP